MPATETNLADRSGNLVESHKGYDPRLIFFYFVVAALLLTLIGGLGYQQLHLISLHQDRERKQNQRRVLIPGPRGNIYDRNGATLVTNKSRWTVVLHLDELRGEFEREQKTIQQNYKKLDEKDVPSWSERRQIALVSVTQRYLDQINRILHRELPLDVKGLRRHFGTELLKPFTLVDELDDADYARLIERLPVNSPLQVYATNVRAYPYGSAAAHTLGYVRSETDVEAPDFPGEDLRTLPMKNTVGKGGLEQWFDADLQGEPGGKIFLVDKDGYKINPPLEQRKPVQGKSLVTSLDIDLQLAAEAALPPGSGEEMQTSAAVAIDVVTGEVLVLASRPDYNLNEFSPRATTEVVRQMNENGAWGNNALNGVWPPGSTFKILTSIAGMRHGTILPNVPLVDCRAHMTIGKSDFVCENGLVSHGKILLPQAIARSCDIYYYTAGLLTTPEVIAAEGRRFHLDRPTGIELPNEQHRTIMPDPDWRRARGEKWYPGDTAHMAIGQGDVLVTPLQMACFAASVARDETFTQPTLIHDPNRPAQHTEPIGLSASQRAALISGMEGCIEYGTASKMLGPQGPLRIPGVRVAGKTGTAQKDVVKDGKHGKINYAWFICFAPVEKPEIAIAVAVEGDVVGESFEGGRYAAPVASAILKTYFAKKANPTQKILFPSRS
jgi:penicillin-binding protein 2